MITSIQIKILGGEAMTRFHGKIRKTTIDGGFSIPSDVVGVETHGGIAGIIGPRTSASVFCTNRAWSRVKDQTSHFHFLMDL